VPTEKISALPQRSLRLCGKNLQTPMNRRDTENAEEAQRENPV